MSAECCGARVFRHATVFPWWMKEEDNAIRLQEKGDIVIYYCFVFYVGLFLRDCCRLKTELHPTLRTRYWGNAFQF